MEIIGMYKEYPIIKGHLTGKPCIGGGSVKGMNTNEIVDRIFVHIGQKYKSNLCMDSWAPEPAGWIVEFATCYMTVGMIDDETPPHGLMAKLAEEHAILRQYDTKTGHLIQQK